MQQTMQRVGLGLLLAVTALTVPAAASPMNVQTSAVQSVIRDIRDVGRQPAWTPVTQTVLIERVR